MPDRLLIRYSGPRVPLRGWRVGDGGATPLGTVDVASGWPGELPVWVVVPAQHVGYARTQIGVRNRDQLAKAVPFALEEQLAEPVEQLHFIVTARADGTQDAWWVNRARLQQWLDDLTSRGVTPTVLLSEAALLTEHPDSLAGARDDQRALLLSDDARTSVPLAVGAEFPIHAPPLESGAHAAPMLDDLLLFAAAHAPTRPASNLLSDGFAARHATAPMRTLWRAAAALALIAIGLSVGWLFADTARLEKRRAELFERQQELYRSIVPGAAAVPDPVGQLRGLDRTRGGTNSDFLALAADAASLLGSSPQVKLQRLDWRSDMLELTLIGSDVAALDAFREQCAQLSGIEAQLGAVGSIAGGSEGKIQLRRRPA